MGLFLVNALTQGPIPNPNRSPHPGIAPPIAPLGVPSSPLLAIPDGIWNHGEGLGATPIDHGGWFDNTDGTNVTLSDVHVEPWQAHPSIAPTMMRLEGYLRPAGIPLPHIHPIYGDLSSFSPAATYVDQGAFEVFKPINAWSGIGSKKILVVVHCWQTLTFPSNSRDFSQRLLYRGIFSQDGLVRSEPAAGHTIPTFLVTDSQDGDEVERPVLETMNHYAATGGTPAYWPIEAYAVATVPGRSTTLNEQRYMQLVQAIKVLLASSGPQNPIYPHPPLSQNEIDANVVVGLIGGSNGGMQSSLATLRFPHLIHGNFSWVINPSYQRLYAEFDLNRALTELTGAGFGLNECGNEDFLVWNQYVWSQGLEMHDMSCLRSFVRGTSYRPMCFAVGDEDVTSSGTNWVRVIDGSIWRDHGLVQSQGTFGSQAANTFGWMAGETVRHSYSVGPSTNPYTNAAAYVTPEVAVDFWPTVIAQRNAELAMGFPVPVPALSHTPRTADQQMRGLDDPQEWWLGRLGEDIPPPAPNAPLWLDTAFSDAVNPGFTGNMPGGKEAMFIKEQRVYVGSADGFVTRFRVDDTTNPIDPKFLKYPLVTDARSRQLGFECYGLAPISNGSTWFVAATTRRHLHKLDKDTLQVIASVELPWEVGRAHHVVGADVLPGHSGPEILFASVHGGLCFYDFNLQPVYEWPEPGIYDFFVNDGKVTFLSPRGVVATVQFDSSNVAQLVNVTKPFATDLGPTYGSPANPACMGYPNFDLELMKANLSAIGMGIVPVAASTWVADIDKNAVRVHALANLQGLTLVSLPTQPILDVATCIEANATPPAIGDHLLVLLGEGQLCLYDQFGNLQAATSLVENEAGQHYPFGVQAHHIVVGNLTASSAGPYSEQVVVATNTGLMWLHINELLGHARLPAQGNAQTHAITSGFWVETNQGLAPHQALSTTHVQARTNQALQSTWAMSRRPVGAVGTALDSDLHVLDQRGVYWKVGYSGQAQMWMDTGVPGIRGWDYVGPLTTTGGQIQSPHLSFLPVGAGTLVFTAPYCPIDPFHAAEESFPAPYTYNQANWLRRYAIQGHCDGFMLHPYGGSLLTNGANREVWHWTGMGGGSDITSTTAMQQWNNLVQALRLDNNGVVNGIWVSTDEVATQNTYLHLRSHNNDAITGSQQALAAVQLLNGSTAVVLGCPGGRVRVLVPGAMRTDDNTAHVLGSGAAVPGTDDEGMGVSALAVRPPGAGGDIEIWFGTIASNDRRPQQYVVTNGALHPSEVGAGSLHRVTWNPGSGFGAMQTWPMGPTPASMRGASAVVGLLLADVILEPQGTPVEDELVVATLSGDLVVYRVSNMTELVRTFVPGGIGCYNALRVANLGGGAGNELYVAGSCGLWRFIQNGG